MLQDSGNWLNELLKLVVPAVIGGVVGVISSIFATRAKMREIVETYSLDQRAKEIEAKTKIRIQYLNPLHIATADLHERFVDIERRVGERDDLLRNTMRELKDGAHRGREYVDWVNGLGHYGISTLYLTLVFLAQVRKIRSELPFLELTSGEDQALLGHLARIRRAFGGDYGIWRNLQDSLGSYVRKADGSLMDYREFCTLLGDDSVFPWFNRLVEFYRDIERKTPAQRGEMAASLSDLLEFLKQGQSKSVVRAEQGTALR